MRTVLFVRFVVKGLLRLVRSCVARYAQWRAMNDFLDVDLVDRSREQLVRENTDTPDIHVPADRLKETR